MGYKIVTQKDCSCYVCASLNNNKENVAVDRQLMEILGFIPEMYNLSIHYKSYHEFGRKKEHSDSELPFITSERIRKIKLILTRNEEERTLLQKKKVTKKFHTYCFICGLLHKKHQAHFVAEQTLLGPGEKKFFCPECSKLYFASCQDCGALEEKERIKIVGGRKRVCHSCFRTYSRCFGCGAHHKTPDMNLTILSVKIDSSIYTDMTQPLCFGCFSTLTHCSCCGKRELAKNISKEKCYTCNQILSTPIHQWSFKPAPIFRALPTERIKKDTLFFGVEWEVENHTEFSHESHIKKLHTFFPPTFFYCKTDSSIHHGFEIVTQPFTWEVWKEDKDKWAGILTYCKDAKLASLSPKYGAGKWEKTCGIHIHTSKNAYTTGHLYKFMKFMYDKENREFILHISSRVVSSITGKKENEYFSFRKQDLNALPQCAKEKQLASHERHSAINLMLPSTVENRIFNSTLDVQEFFKNMEFSHAAFYFSRDTSMRSVRWEDFLAYIAQKPKTYSNLHMYIKSKIGDVYGTFLSNATTK